MNYWALPGEQILNSLWIQLKLSWRFGWCENERCLDDRLFGAAETGCWGLWSTRRPSGSSSAHGSGLAYTTRRHAGSWAMQCDRRHYNSIPPSIRWRSVRSEDKQQYSFFWEQSFLNIGKLNRIQTQEFLSYFLSSNIEAVGYNSCRLQAVSGITFIYKKKRFVFDPGIHSDTYQLTVSYVSLVLQRLTNLVMLQTCKVDYLRVYLLKIEMQTA